MTVLKPFTRGTRLHDVFAQLPQQYNPLIDYHEALLRGDSPLTVAERELIAAFVSGLNACAYCHGVHSRTAEAFGLSANLLAALSKNIDAAPVDPRLKPILHYVAKLTRTPSRMTSADAETVFAAGWNDRALHDAIAVCALFNLMNRLVEGLGIEGDEHYARSAGQRLKREGYLGLKT